MTEQRHDFNCVRQAEPPQRPRLISMIFRNRLAQDVNLHDEFRGGINSPHDPGSILARTEIIIGFVQNAANLAALQLEGCGDETNQDDGPQYR